MLWLFSAALVSATAQVLLALMIVSLVVLDIAVKPVDRPVLRSLRQYLYNRYRLGYRCFLLYLWTDRGRSMQLDFLCQIDRVGR
jgi:hypothetical protein